MIIISPRWSKILHDLWENKTRTALVVAAIAVGVTAFGILSNAQATLSANMSAQFVSINPASASLTLPPFQEDFVQGVLYMDGIAEAEGRRAQRARLRLRDGSWAEITLIAVSNFERMTINRVIVEGGEFPPGSRDVLLERSTASYFGLSNGDTLTVEFPYGDRYELLVVGTVHDLTQTPSNLIPNAVGFVSADTLAWMGQPNNFNQLDIVVDGDRADRDHIASVVDRLTANLKHGPHEVIRAEIPPPLQHPMATTITTVNFLLTVLSVGSYTLSGFLIYNTVAALLSQQTRQIGIMKAMGARSWQIMRIYLTIVLIFGALALLVALPISRAGARWFAAYAAALLNFDILEHQQPPEVLWLQVGMALIAPVLAALQPIIYTAGISVREALSDYGISQTARPADLIDRLVERIRGLPRPLLVSLRNTFRKRARLILTVAPLAIAGATLIAVLGVRAALLVKVNQVLELYHYDFQVVFDRPYPKNLLEHEALSVPGVIDAEGWQAITATIINPDGSQGLALTLIAAPAETAYIQAPPQEGRWLMVGDERAVVVGEDLLNELSSYQVGDTLTLNIAGHQEALLIVGKVTRTGSAGSGPGTGLHLAFVTDSYLGRLLGTTGYATVLAIRTTQRDTAAQVDIGREMEEHFKDMRISVERVRTIQVVAADMTVRMNVLIGLMLIMALLLALVGMLGLSGTMSLNIMERTREIGVLRAIGARRGAIYQIVIAEGVTIAIISWAVSVALAIPLTRYLSNAVGLMFINEPLAFTFSFDGIAIWLGLSIALAALASLFPARRASRVSVREALVYE